LRKQRAKIYPRLEAMTKSLVDGVMETAHKAGAALTANRVGSMFTWFFTRGPITDWTSAARCDVRAFAKFHRGMLDAGIYLPPSQFEAAFVSAAHSDADIEKTVAAARKVFGRL
jgi:glutamate-1-semialdehyde 2,1-aminomutase